MAKKFMGLLAAMAVIGGIATLVAEEAKPTKGGEGTLMVQDKNYSLKHALAYETMMDDEERIVVVLSGQAVSGEKLKEAKAEEKDGHDASFNKPYLKLEFTKAGELSRWSAGAGNSFMNKGSSGVSAELKSQDGRVIGKASQPNETEGNFRSGFDVHFDTKLLTAGDSLPATKKPGPAANVKPSVTGTFKGNGKEAKISFVSAHWREPFSDKPSMVLVFTEKDHSKDSKPDFNAAFEKFGSALIISLHEDGGIFGCQVVHSAISKKGFSSTGQIHTDDFEFEDGKVQGVASATTPAAGTAQTSDRWWRARAASSRPRRRPSAGRGGTVAIGFIAARTRSTPPVDIPPSVPPERPVGVVTTSSRRLHLVVRQTILVVAALGSRHRPRHP